MTGHAFDPSRNPTAHVLSVGSVLTVLTVGAVTLVQATPSWWRLLLFPLVLLPALTLRRPALALAGSEERSAQQRRAPAVPAPVYDLRAARALRYGWVDPDDDGLPRAA